MKAAVLAVAGIVAGMLLAFVLVVAVEAFSAVVHPLPEDFDGSAEQMCAHVERNPAWVLGVVVPAWAATALAGVWLAGAIGKVPAAAVVGLLLVAAVALNLWMLPYPVWFEVATLVAVTLAVWAGVRWSRRPRAATEPEATE